MSEFNMQSKLPNLETSIFTKMSKMANQYNAINLSQGFPEFDTPAYLKRSVIDAIMSGKNQYAPSHGSPELLLQLEHLIKTKYQKTLSSHECITITSGATEALFVAIQTIVKPNDEVIIFDPAYDSYEPAVELAGGKCVHIPLSSPDYKINWQDVKKQITPNTRAIIVNTPHNPTGTLLTQYDIHQLHQLVTENNLYLISDEVYEYITFEGEQHESILKYPELFDHAFVISSFGKTFHCTGWKLGYCTAPKHLTNEFRKIHQYVTFSSFTPAQIGIAAMLKQHPEHISELGHFYQQKKALLVSALADSNFKILPSKGTYFILLDYSAISTLDDVAFCQWLTQEIGVAAIPLSPFYQSDTLYSDKIIRLCFAKEDTTLLEAAKKLSAL